MYQQNFGGYNQYPQQQYNQYPQQRGYNQYPQQQQQRRKRSGCKTKRYTPTSGVNAGREQICTSGWKKNRQGFSTFMAVTTRHSRDKGKGWVGGVRITVTNQSSGQQTLYWGTMQVSTGKVIMSGLPFVMNPKAPNGGYCGTYIKSNRSR